MRHLCDRYIFLAYKLNSKADLPKLDSHRLLLIKQLHRALLRARNNVNLIVNFSKRIYRKRSRRYFVHHPPGSFSFKLHRRASNP